MTNAVMRWPQCDFTPTSIFSGLTPEYKPIFHEELLSLIYYGNGFTWTDVYNLPVWLRRFYIKKLNAIRHKENEQIESLQNNPTPVKSAPRPSPAPIKSKK